MSADSKNLGSSKSGSNNLNAKDLLIELGTEELPPKALKKLSAAFTAGIVDGLKAKLPDAMFYEIPRYRGHKMKTLPCTCLQHFSVSVFFRNPPHPVFFIYFALQSKVTYSCAFAGKNSLKKHPFT